jgi:hypothetical protein
MSVAIQLLGGRAGLSAALDWAQISAVAETQQRLEPLT